MPKERVKFRGKWYQIQDVKSAKSSTDPEVKEAYQIKYEGSLEYVLNTECEEVIGQNDTQTSR